MKDLASGEAWRMVNLQGERHSYRERIGPLCNICGKEGATPTVLRSDSRAFMSLFPLNFRIDASCESCWQWIFKIGNAAKQKAAENGIAPSG